MRLALTGAFRARWNERIHDEWTRNVLLKFPASCRRTCAYPLVDEQRRAGLSRRD